MLSCYRKGLVTTAYSLDSGASSVGTLELCSVYDVLEPSSLELTVSSFLLEGSLSHKMDIDAPENVAGTSSNLEDVTDTKVLTLRRFKQSLVHSSQCRDLNCHLNSCIRMKKMLAHAKQCKKQTQGGCTYCKQLLALCCLHGRECTATKCTVLYCSTVKRKMMEKREEDADREHEARQRVTECVVCMAEPSTTAFFPCGHKHTCRTCAKRICEIDPPTCPTCRGEIENHCRIWD